MADRGVPKRGHTSTNQTRSHDDMEKRQGIHARLAAIEGEQDSNIDITKQTNFDRGSQRMRMFTEREKEKHHIMLAEQHILDKLIGFNDGPRKKPPSFIETYPKEWAELNTPQEKLDYELRMRKYRPRDFATPYGKEWHDLATPHRDFWNAPTPLYDEICRRTATIPPELEKKNYSTVLKPKHSALKRLSENARDALRRTKIAAADARFAYRLRRPRDPVRSRPNRTRSFYRYDNRIATPMRNTRKRLTSPSNQSNAEEDRPHTAPAKLGSPRTKHSFFNLPGENGPPPKAREDGAPEPGARTTVARLLFGRASFGKKKKLYREGLTSSSSEALSMVAALG